MAGANFSSLKQLMDSGQLPLMKQVHLFVGSARTLYHCHYDLQPNLHVQLVGSKRCVAPSWTHKRPLIVPLAS